MFEDPLPAAFNYFNYFTEVEDEFVRRRGSPLTISTLDWALVETWKNAGIPLHLVLRSINEAFDGWVKRPGNRRKVNTVFYCQQSVEQNFADYRLGQVGAADEQTEGSLESDAPTTSQRESAFPKEELLGFIGRCDSDLQEAAEAAGRQSRTVLQDALIRSRARLAEIALEIEGSIRVDDEALERDFDGVDRMIVENARIALGEQAVKELRQEAKSELRSYKKKMDKAIYEQTVENFVARRLRQLCHIPRLSLFYM